MIFNLSDILGKKGQYIGWATFITKTCFGDADFSWDKSTGSKVQNFRTFSAGCCFWEYKIRKRNMTKLRTKQFPLIHFSFYVLFSRVLSVCVCVLISFPGESTFPKKKSDTSPWLVQSLLFVDTQRQNKKLLKNKTEKKI